MGEVTALVVPFGFGGVTDYITRDISGGFTPPVPPVLFHASVVDNVAANKVVTATGDVVIDYLL